MTSVKIKTYEERPGAGRLGRHVEHDPRSFHYPSMTGFQPPKPATVLWSRYSPILDQGDIGSCTGNALTGWLGCEPHVHTAAQAAQFDEECAVGLYSEATHLDHIPGSYPPDDTGSSGLAVCKAAKRMMLIAGYGWAFSTAHLLRALQRGPVIVGVPWFEGFDTPDNTGLVEPTGTVRGGHEFVVRGFNAGDGVLMADNSWGSTWGVHGSFRFTVATWDVLRSQQADVTVPQAVSL